MTTRHFLPMTLLALAVLAGCSTLAADNANLDAARRDYRSALDNPQTSSLAPAELRQAADALKLANDAQARKAGTGEVNHLAYIATTRTAVAVATAERKIAEQAVTAANAQRDQQRLAARTTEADTAQRNAANAQGRADASQRQADASQRQADSSQQQAAMSAQQTAEAQARTRALEQQLNDMNAKQTDRGMVVTFGDVLFDTNASQLKPGGMHNVEKLVGFLKQYPQRKAMVEGFTDSVGSEGTNQALSGRRADAVRAAMVERGIGSDRLSTMGYGESFPVAGNDSAGGRQMNRRVEIVLSDDNGRITPR